MAFIHRYRLILRPVSTFKNIVYIAFSECGHTWNHYSYVHRALCTQILSLAVQNKLSPVTTDNATTLGLLSLAITLRGMSIS